MNGVTLEGSNETSNGRACRFRNRSEIKNPVEWSDSESDTDGGGVPRVTTRRAWSDYCSNRGRSSLSEDEPGGGSVGRGRTTQKKKQLRRKLPRSGKPPPSSIAPARSQAKRPKARQPRRSKPKKAIKITGLDLLHSETLLSTSAQSTRILLFDFLRQLALGRWSAWEICKGIQNSLNQKWTISL